MSDKSGDSLLTRLEASTTALEARVMGVTYRNVELDQYGGASWDDLSTEQRLDVIAPRQARLDRAMEAQTRLQAELMGCAEEYAAVCAAHNEAARALADEVAATVDPRRGGDG